MGVPGVPALGDKGLPGASAAGLLPLGPAVDEGESPKGLVMNGVSSGVLGIEWTGDGVAGDSSSGWMRKLYEWSDANRSNLHR